MRGFAARTDVEEVERFLAARLGAYDLQVTDVSAALEYKLASKPPRPENATV